MKRTYPVSLAITMAVLVLACDKKLATPVDSAAATTATTAAPAAGGVGTVEVTTSGIGATRDEAIRDAVVRAVEQVHGRAISVSTVSRELGTVTRNKSVEVAGVGASKSESVTATEGGRQLSESTQGLVTSIRIVEEDEGRKGWSVKIAAAVAKFTPPSANKIRVVIGAPKGGNGVDLDATSAATLRDRITATLGATGRLALLNRGENNDIDAELALAGSASAAREEALKQGQTQVADVVVQLTVKQLEVDRQSRTLRMTGREVVNYRGSASASYTIVHVATREVLSSGEAKATRSSEDALRDDVNADAWKQEMIAEIAGHLAAQAADALVPVRVIDRQGRDVTLNAGRSRITDAAYDVIVVGAAIKDPTTGETLGQRERSCCKLTITRGEEKLSFGTLDQVPTLTADEVLQIRPISRN